METFSIADSIIKLSRQYATKQMSRGIHLDSSLFLPYLLYKMSDRHKTTRNNTGSEGIENTLNVVFLQD